MTKLTGTSGADMLSGSSAADRIGTFGGHYELSGFNGDRPAFRIGKS